MRGLAVRLARRDFSTFFKYVFGLAPAAHHRKWMAAVQQYDRAVILAPIEHGKTTILSVAFPLWVLGTIRTRESVWYRKPIRKRLDPSLPSERT